MRKPLVYYVDDSQDALDLVDFVVKDDDRFQLIGMKTEQELYDELKKNTPDLLLLDLNLGQNLTGSVLSLKLRQEYQYIPIVIYTSYEKTRVKQLIPDSDLESGRTLVWQKSEIDIGELADSIAKVIGD